jgi:very-short-patch-repair endonuclease
MESNKKKMSYAWNMHYGADSQSKQRAKSLRKNLTDAEKHLWSLLRNRNLGFKFRRQHSIGIYIVDFYCHELELVIELDGEHHYESNQKRWDEGRTNDFRSLGIKLIRFRNIEVLNNTEKVLTQISKKCFELSNNIEK